MYLAAWIPLGLGLLRADESREYRLRIAWGGAKATQWRGDLRVFQGHVTRYAPLGTDPDVPGSLRRIPRGLAIQSLRPNLYQAVDVVITGRENARLRIRLGGVDDREFALTREFALSEFWGRDVNDSIDAAGNTLLIQSTPGDLLRVDPGRDHLVFMAGDTWQLDVQPRDDLRATAKATLTVDMTSAASRRVTWRTQTAVPLVASGERLANHVRVGIPIPSQEGVYDLKLRFLAGSARLMPPVKTAAAERSIQFVVVDPQRRSEAGGESQVERWPELIRFDPSEPRWWESWVAIPPWHQVPGDFGDLVRGGASQPWVVEETRYSRLDPLGWRALPLSVRRIHEPHVVELQLPAGIEQSVALCIVEADAAGRILPRIAGAAFSQSILPGDIPTRDSYRFLFWPRTRRPALVVMNLRGDGPAAFGQVTVRQGPTQLPTLDGTRLSVGQREVLAHFEEPQLADMFSAADALDPSSGRPLTDWTTFYESGIRLTDYLRFAGYTGATIGCLCDGAVIMPAPAIEGASRFDTGAYFQSGQDPFRKDVLELLFRLFDREGLHLVPGLRFSSRLPALEALLAEERTPAGVELVHRDGRNWRTGLGRGQISGPFYNPLDPRVRRALTGIVRDLVSRYGQHPSFAGIRLDLSPNTYTQLPDEQWGYDSATIARFLDGEGTGSKAAIASSTVTSASLLDEPVRSRWLAWREAQVSSLYAGMLQEIQSVRPEARLYFSTGGLLEAPSVRRLTSPALPRGKGLRLAMGTMGLDVSRWVAERGVVFPRPYVTANSKSLISQGRFLELQNDAEFDELF
ncbi:MAG TPA: family 10 glycosylhydrolase, partial [Pirellulaceae bacterium]